MDIRIRWQIRRDLKEVLEIERNSFAIPWQERDFIEALRERNVIGQVAVDVTDDKELIAGYMIYELHPDRLHLLNLAVDPESRNKGVARSLINKLLSKLSPDRRRFISLEVQDINLPAQLFFKSMGFRAVDILKNYYDDTDSDAYMFEYKCKQFANSQ